MSNTVVGPTYKRILDQVIEASRTDFEENGVQNAVLETMKQKWQERLTSLDRAEFPWDEQKHQDAAPKYELSQNNSPGGALQHGNSTSNSFDAPPIKQEAYEQNFLNLPPRGNQTGVGSNYASNRAAHLLQQQFGSQANSSIGALQAAQQQSMNRNYGNLGQQQAYAQYPQQSPYATPPTQQGQQPRQAQPPPRPVPQQQQQQQQPNYDAKPYIKQESNGQQNGGGSSQLDGIAEMADEHDAILAVPDTHGGHRRLARVDADNTIRCMIEQASKRREGGGLLLPLSEIRPTRPMPSWVTNQSTVDSMASHGGDAADDEDDEDAINSDLDDPDDLNEANLEGVYEGDVVLCLYDKVQRVKNKWKCTLREGILTIEGKDYLFHKANGEFEW